MARSSRTSRGHSSVSHSDTEWMTSATLTDTYEGESSLPAGTKKRLHDLFGKIEKEFERLHNENVQLRHRVQELNERVEHAAGKKERSSSANVFVSHSIDSGPDTPPAKAPSVIKKTDKSANQISQKLKNTYKSHTSRIVSSFRTPSSSSNRCQLKRHFRSHRDGVWEVNVSKTDRQIIGTASADQTCRLWYVQNGTCLLQYVGHKGSVNSVRFHPSQDLVLTSSGDNTAHIWRATVTKPLLADSPRAHSSEDEVDTSERDDTEDDRHGDHHVIRQPMSELRGHMSPVIAADWMTDGSRVISASWDRTANLYNVETGDIIQTFVGHDQELTNVASHAQQQLIVTTGRDTTFRLWDLRDCSMKLNVSHGHTQSVTSAAFVGSDKIVSGSDDSTCKVWDLRNMRSPLTTIRTDSPVNRLAVHAVYQKIAIPQDNRHIRIYDLNGERFMRLPRNSRQGHNRMVCSLAWNDRDSASTCNLYSCAFDRQVLGWHINLQPKD